MKQIWLYGMAALLLVGLTQCKKADPPKSDDPLGPVSEVPEITLDEVTPTAVKEFTDPITFTITYLDGDGDIGYDNADSVSIQLIDNRDPANIIQGYHIPPVTPDGQTIAITGVFNVVLERTNLLDPNNTSETTTYTLKLKDRAGNWSNEVETETITITK